MGSENTDRLSRIWYGMNWRCRSSKLPQETAIYYRDKGITVCCEWKDSLDSFKEWALNNGYADNLTIDRIDSGGIYCPENCQWLTKSENSKKAAIERRKHKSENHSQYGLWMVVEKVIYMYLNGHTYYAYKVIETGLYKSEAIHKAKELNSEKPWQHKYRCSPTQKYRVGDLVSPNNISCFLNK